MHLKGSRAVGPFSSLLEALKTPETREAPERERHNGMWSVLVTVLIGTLGGIAVGLQGPIATQMGKRIGSAASSLVVHVSGAILSGMLVLIRGGENIQNWRSLSWYMLGSGVFGLVLYLTINHTMPRLGATTALALIIIGQLSMGLVIDHFGLFGTAIRHLDAGRAAGLILLMAGGYLVVR
jgi:bacterial/archaeal transporter family-2 protein